MPKEKKLFQMAVSSRNNSGFTLVEILLYISFYGLVMALLIPCAEGIIKVDNRLEMEGFCQRLAAEVTALQQAALWGAGLQNKLTVDLDQQCYYVYREGKIVKKVRLQEIIKNRRQPQLVKKFEVQPVTGRVVVSEIK